ncbi:MAG: hypothetical protein ACRD2W_18650 [Acidimicrobiales bacterium]
MDEIEICFTEQEVAQILWGLAEASDLATASDALSNLALIEETLRMVRDRFDRRNPSSPRYRWAMAERVKVTEAVRRTGVPGTVVFLAIRHGEITSVRDDRGYDWVDPDEVASLAVPR